eukprot:1155963-Pelagomonas_calceolata.AAC.2
MDALKTSGGCRSSWVLFHALPQKTDEDRYFSSACSWQLRGSFVVFSSVCPSSHEGTSNSPSALLTQKGRSAGTCVRLCQKSRVPAGGTEVSITGHTRRCCSRLQCAAAGHNVQEVLQWVAMRRRCCSRSQCAAVGHNVQKGIGCREEWKEREATCKDGPVQVGRGDMESYELK